MTNHATALDSIKRSLVGLRMPRALEVLDATVRSIEQGEIDAPSIRSSSRSSRFARVAGLRRPS